jgi:hypothetical protein
MPFLLSQSPSRFGLNRSVWARRSVHQFPCLGTSAALCLTTSTVLLLLLAFGILEKQPGYGRAGGRRRPPPCGHRYSGVRSGQRPVAQDRTVPSKNCRSTAAGDFLPAPATDARKGVVELCGCCAHQTSFSEKEGSSASQLRHHRPYPASSCCRAEVASQPCANGSPDRLRSRSLECVLFVPVPFLDGSLLFLKNLDRTELGI